MELKRGNCADFGVNSKTILDFINKNEKDNLGLNSLMLIKDGTVVAEGYYPPYDKDSKQVMYSISKSITATALGFAVSEGKVSLDDSICKYYGVYDKSGKNARITIRHLVTMTACKNVPMARNRHNKDWIKIFFDSNFLCKPGEKYLYVNDNFYMISAIITKVYGESLVDFLMPRLFEPLGIERPYWECDNKGIASGGWGLFLSTEDLARIMYCYSQDGMFDGKQVIPYEWVQQSTKYQVPTTKKGHIDNIQGYGYGLWMTSLPNTYRAYGLYGQQGYVFKDDNAVLILTAAISKDEAQSDAVNDMYQTLFTSSTPEYDTALYEKLSNLDDKDNLPINPRNYRYEKLIHQRTIKTTSNSFVSMLNVTITTVMDRVTGRIDRFSFRNDTDGNLYMLWKEQTDVNEVKLGMDNNYETSVVKIAGTKFTANSKASWTKPDELTVVIRFSQTCHEKRLVFTFKNGRAFVKNTSYPTLPELAAHYVNFSGIVLPEPVNNLLEKVIAPAILVIGEQNFISKSHRKLINVFKEYYK